MTAVDSSPIAIERARARAEQQRRPAAAGAGRRLRVWPDGRAIRTGLRRWPLPLIRQTHLEQFVDLLWRVTQPGSYYFTVAARKHESSPDGPPPVSQKQIHRELGAVPGRRSCGRAGWPVRG